MFDELDGLDLEGLSDVELNELMRRLEAAQRQLSALRAEVTSVWDARRCWSLDRARSGAAWLRGACKVDAQTASAQVRLARALRSMPATAAALRDGEVSEDQARVLARAACNRRAGEAFERDEKLLLDQAREPQLSMVAFRRAVQYWLLANDPDGADAGAARQHGERRAHLVQSFAGWWHGECGLPPIEGAIVNETWSEIERELYEADVAVARTAGVVELCRTASQRRADALVEMAIRARTVPKDGRRPKPLFSVVLDSQTFADLVCELEGGTVLSPQSLLAYLPDSLIERIVFDGPSRVLDIGVQRTYRGALRRAIQVRDRECFDPLCDVPAVRCQIDHRVRYRDGGATTATNGRAGCSFHNLERERRPDDGGPAP